MKITVVIIRRRACIVLYCFLFIICEDNVTVVILIIGMIIKRVELS